MAALEFSVARLWRWAAVNVVFIIGFVAIAGRTDLPWMWAYLALWAALTLYAFAAVDPELSRERRTPGGPSVDPIALVLMRLLGVAILVIALLDIGRFHWTDDVPPSWHVIGLALGGIGTWLTFRAMAVNRFFSTAVRVQRERGHHVITDGPYRVVRHPGYAGMLFAAPGGALLLGSWLALVPALLFCALVLRRVTVEDAFLRRHLAGYADYASRVRFRLVPRLW